MPEDPGLPAKSEGFRVEILGCSGAFAVYCWGTWVGYSPHLMWLSAGFLFDSGVSSLGSLSVVVSTWALCALDTTGALKGYNGKNKGKSRRMEVGTRGQGVGGFFRLFVNLQSD